MTGWTAPGDWLPADDYLMNLEHFYKETNNPVMVWWAIHWCLNEGPQHAFPDWCLDYLAETAAKLGRLGQEVVGDAVTVGEIGKGSGRARTPTANQLMAILGFSTQGKSAFRQAFSDMRKLRAASRFDGLVRSGVPPAKAMEIIRVWLGEPEDGNTYGNTRKTIQAGRRLLKGKTST
jgi:hypothetical protein